MARVPAVTNISKDTSTPEHRPLDVDDDAGVLDVDAEIPDDFDWDALPDDDEPMPYSDDEDPQPDPPQSHDPPPEQPQNNHREPNGHASPPVTPKRSVGSASQSPSRSDGVVADPMGVDGLEDGEIEQKPENKDQRCYKKKRRRGKNPNSEVLHCDICGVTCTGRAPMDAHLKGNRHVNRARQVERQEKNKELAAEEHAVHSQNTPPVEPRRPEDEWDSTNTPPKPVPPPAPAGASNGERRNLSGRAEVRSEGRDPYASKDRDRKTDVRMEARDPYSREDREQGAEGGSQARDPYSRNDRDHATAVRSQARDPYARSDRDHVTEVRSEGRDPYVANDRDRRTDVRSEVGDPYATTNRDHGNEASRDIARDPRIANRDPRLNRPTSQAAGSQGGGKKRTTEARPGRDPYAVNTAQEANGPRKTSDSAKGQENGALIQADASEAKKRKRSDSNAAQGIGQEDGRSSIGDRERAHGYESVADGSVRRRLSDTPRDPGLRDPYASREPPRQPAPTTEKPAPPLTKPAPAPPPTRTTAPPARLTAPPARPAAPPARPTAPPVGPPPRPARPAPPPLVSAPAPAPNNTGDDRRPTDQTRRFTYGSVRRDSLEDRSSVIPHEWLSQLMDTREWRDLRHNTFTKGSDVDKLAFKMVQEILLSPVLGIRSDALAPFSRGMLEAVRNQHLSRDNESDTYAKFESYPESLSVRDDNYARADPEWQKTQTPEQMAIRLVSDNVYFCLHSYEDREAANSTEPHNFPRRGSFGANNMTKSSRDGGVAPRYADSVEQDALFNELYDHLLRKYLGG